MTLAEIQELRANPDAEACGFVIESRLDPGRGPVVTLLIHRGRMKVGDSVVAGEHWGRVRAMHDYRGAGARGGHARHAGRDPRLRRRPRRRRALPRGRERPRGEARRQRALDPREAGGARAPGRPQGLARGRARPRRARREGAQPRAQGRRGRLARGARRRDRPAPAGPGAGEHHPRGRGRHRRVRRDARRRLRRRDHRLQRPPGGQRRPRSPTARASRSAPTR